jgi:hypothetical protein
VNPLQRSCERVSVVLANDGLTMMKPRRIVTAQDAGLMGKWPLSPRTRKKAVNGWGDCTLPWERGRGQQVVTQTSLSRILFLEPGGFG